MSLPLLVFATVTIIQTAINFGTPCTLLPEYHYTEKTGRTVNVLKERLTIFFFLFKTDHTKPDRQALFL